MISKFSISALVFSPLTAFAGSSAPAIDQTTITTPAEASPWTVRTALYGWAQGLDGDIAVRGRPASVNLGFDDILKDLDIAVMGAVEINRGRWGFMADINYAKISTGRSAGPVSIDVENSQFLGNFVATYQAVRSGTISLDAYAGVRVNSIDLKLDVNDFTPANKDFSRSQSKTWVDPIIGGRFQAELSDKFFFRAVGDIGGFGISSDLTWQAMAGFGWRVTENGSLLAGYRGIGTDYTDGGFHYDIIAHGPILGFEYKF
jgi:opacity protein-like surface antigen